PPESIPVFERGRRPPPDLAYDARLDRLKSVRNAIAEALPLAPGVLCPNAILEAIARQEPAGMEQLQEVEGMRRWQREVLGERLLAVLRAT
ncbi:MAG: HRDC domain-containing protein, partial [Gemmatimonadota bacterium]|nr:HRDC domain-containing protein [Gemmatimonadota bacterium]